MGFSSATPAIVAYASSTGGGRNQCNTPSADWASVAPDLVIMIGTCYWGPNHDNNFSDSSGNTWVLAKAELGTTRVEIYYCYNPTLSGSQVFSTDAGGNQYGKLLVLGYSGANASPVDSTASSYHSSGDGPPNSQNNSVTLSPTVDNSLIVSAISRYATTNSVAFTSRPGWTYQYDLYGNSDFPIFLDVKLQSTKQNETPSYSWNDRDDWSTVVGVTFKPAAGAGGSSKLIVPPSIVIPRNYKAWAQ